MDAGRVTHLALDSFPPQFLSIMSAHLMVVGGTLLTVFAFGVTPHLPNPVELPASW